MPDNDFISRHEHNEFARRMEEANQRIMDENKRQNERLKIVEEAVNKINELALSVAQMATSIETMADALKKQGLRLETIEQKPAKRWEAVVEKIIFLALGAAAAMVGAKIGL